MVEGKGSRVGLIIAVPNPRTFSFITPVPAEETAIIAGANAKQGMTTAELDITAAANAVISPMHINALIRLQSSSEHDSFSNNHQMLGTGKIT